MGGNGTLDKLTGSRRGASHGTDHGVGLKVPGFHLNKTQLLFFMLPNIGASETRWTLGLGLVLP